MFGILYIGAGIAIMATLFRYNQESGRSNFVTLVIASMVIIVALGTFAAILFSRLVDRVIFDSLVKPGVLNIQRQVSTHLFEQNRFYDWQNPMSVYHFGEFLNDIKSIGDVKRVNIFSRDNVLAFSTVTGDVGKIVADPSVERALQGEIVIEEPDVEDSSGVASGNILELYVPAIGGDGSVLGVVSVYVDETALLTFRKELYLLVVMLGILSVMTIITVISIGFRGQSAVIKKQARELGIIIEKAPIGIYIVNKKGIVEVYNSKMVEFAGAQSSSEIIGLNVFELQTYKDAGLDVFLKKGFAGESLEKDVEYTSHVSGKKMWRRYHGVPLTDMTGKYIDRILLIVEDATTSKQFEQELKKKVWARTVELQKKIEELETFKDLTIGRELKMIELKKIVKEKEQNDRPHA